MIKWFLCIMAIVAVYKKDFIGARILVAAALVCQHVSDTVDKKAKGMAEE